ncbi:MAG: DUF1080 domain-containing protein [Bacteroidales bacterium]|jgi:hypothetical protein|nr:DUF1080 domain-containing protein [Bacteroidales bacterium]
MKKYIALLTVSFFVGQIFAQDLKWKPEHTEYWNNQPEIITPGEGTKPPSDAIVLFNGKDLSEWVCQDGTEPKWKIEKDIMTVVGGAKAIQTKKVFGSCQLHIEWRTPAEVNPKKTGQGRGNSGIFLQSRYELQVLDNYDNKTYSNGQAGSIYKQTAPLVNVCRKPGEWQVYDIIYTAPEFNGKGEVVTPAYITVIQNGVVVQNHTEIKGNTEYIGLPAYKPHGKLPIILQDHGDAVSFRNIWIRDL